MPAAAETDTPIASAPRRVALSPSRAADFQQCPLLYRFRVVDKLPEPPTRAQVMGTLVHSVLEQLFAKPAVERGKRTAIDLVRPSWEQLAADHPEYVELFDTDDEADFEQWLRQSGPLLDGYYLMEDPRRFEPESCEQLVEVEMDSGLVLRGFIDRVDVAPTGQMRVVDYKTGKKPRQAYQDKALFQMKFYALVILKARNILPTQLRLMYIGANEDLTYSPTERELQIFAGKLEKLWQEIVHAARTGEFQPKPTRLCPWCAHQSICPAQGGTAPKYLGWPQLEAQLNANEQ